MSNLLIHSMSEFSEIITEALDGRRFSPIA